MPNILKIIYGKHATQMYGFAFAYVGVCAFLMVFLLMSPLGHEYIYFWIVGGCCSFVSLMMLIFLFNQDKFVGNPKYESDK